MADSQDIPKCDDYSLLYSNRITTIYIQYLEKHYPEIDVNGLLEYAGMTIDQVQTQGYWFNQIQVDRFHEKLVELTHRNDISRIAGQFAPEANMGWLKVVLSGFLLEYVFLAMEKQMVHMTRAVETHTRKLGINKVEIVTKPKPGVNEKRYQCEYRKGAFEGIGTLFYNEPAMVEHPKCFHNGQDCCQYIVTYKKLPHMIWKDILKISYLFSFVFLVSLYFFLPVNLWSLTIVLSVLSISLISRVVVWHEKRYLSSIIEMQKHAAEEHLRESIYAPDISLLLKTINQIGAENISSLKKIISNILKLMRSRFPFDCGAISLLRDERELVYVDHYGIKMEKNNRTYLRVSEFSSFSSIVPKKPVDLFNNYPLDGVVEKGKNYKLENEEGIPFSQYFEEVGVNSLFFFPMLFGKEVLGALLVGFYDSDKKISKAYENTISYFATQIAAVLTHSMLYEQVADKESQHRLLMANLKGMVFRYHQDENKTIDFLSDGCFELTGLQPESFSSFRSYEKLIHSADKKQYFSAVNKINKEYEIEYRIIAVTGEEKWVWEKGKPVVKRDHSVVLEGFITDITEKKVIENLKNEFIDRTSHELRTPLHDIMLNASPFLELKTYFAGLSETAKKKIQRILKTADMMNNTVDDLLSLSRFENRKIVTNLRKIPLYKIIHDGVAGISSHIKAKGHELRIDIDRGIIIDVDTNQMQIVINNLLVNAVKYTPDNGVIIVSTEKRDGMVQIEIIDNGYGVPPEYQERIFQEFFKIKTGKREIIRGTGLGLAIARKIMENHHGKLYCKSPIEKDAFPNLPLDGDRKGSIFIVELSSQP